LLASFSALSWLPSQHAQLSDAAKSAVLIEFNYGVFPNLTYGIASNQELKLDVYRPQGATAPTPVVMLIHGGGGRVGYKSRLHEEQSGATRFKQHAGSRDEAHRERGLRERGRSSREGRGIGC
jgi:predicted dienelactone hydrolase